MVEQLAGPDPLAADVSEAEKALIRFALKLSRDPGAMRRCDVEELRQAGWDDQAVHDACQVVAYYHYVNRVADGLGVELEPDRAIPEIKLAPPSHE